MDFAGRRASDQAGDLVGDDGSGDPNWVSNQPGIRSFRFACAPTVNPQTSLGLVSRRFSCA